MNWIINKIEVFLESGQLDSKSYLNTELNVVIYIKYMLKYIYYQNYTKRECRNFNGFVEPLFANNIKHIVHYTNEIMHLHISICILINSL